MLIRQGHRMLNIRECHLATTAEMAAFFCAHSQFSGTVHQSGKGFGSSILLIGCQNTSEILLGSDLLDCSDRLGCFLFDHAICLVLENQPFIFLSVWLHWNLAIHPLDSLLIRLCVDMLVECASDWEKHIADGCHSNAWVQSLHGLELEAFALARIDVACRAWPCALAVPSRRIRRQICSLL